MSHPISPQHPAVVLRSHYLALRALLAVTTVAVVSLTVAVVILAGNTGDSVRPVAASPVSVSSTVPPDSPSIPPAPRYDGGPDEGTRGPAPAPVERATPLDLRYDGGPEEGSRGPQ